MRESKRVAFGCVAAVAALLMANVAGATPITRAQFGPGSVNFDFGPANAGTLTNGTVTAVGTLDAFLTSNTFVASNVIESANSAGIRLNFTAPVSAVGMDFFANNTPTTLSVFNSANVLLESVTISNVGLPIGSPFAFPFGFIGLDEGANVISFAIINGGLGANIVDERIDNVVYGQAVPEPATLTLTALGLAGFARRYRRRSTQA
jgi:PEP-CTERM motif